MFIPDWLGRTSPRENRDRMMQIVNNLYDDIEEYVQEYIQESGIEDARDVRWTMMQLVNGKVSVVMNMCETAENVIEKLETK